MAAIQEPDIVEQEVPAGIGSLEQQTRGEIDIQISTAKRYPRSIKTFTDSALSMATLNADIAAACIYALPRKERGQTKNIEGPSARLAEICVSAWGHMRVEARPVGEDDRFITVRGMAWDLQQNVAIGFEVKRRITTRGGDKFSDDMISVTSNAAASIAIRNAIFKVIPAAFWKPIYQACRKIVAGDLKTLVNRRSTMFELFQKLGVTNDQVLSILGVKGSEDIGLDELVTLHGIYNSLKDGEATIVEIFGEQQGARPVPAQRVSQQPTQPAAAPSGENGSQQPEARSREMPSAATGTVGGPAPTEPPKATGPATYIGTVAKIEDKGNGAVLVTLNTGFCAATTKPELIQALARFQTAGTVIELGTRPSANGPGRAPILETIDKVEDGQ